MSAFTTRAQSICRPAIFPGTKSLAAKSFQHRPHFGDVQIVRANPEVTAMYDLTEDEIMDKVFELKQELFTMRIRKGVGNEVKTHMFKVHRKKIAQLLTVKRKKEIENGISKRESRKIEKKQLLDAGSLVR